MENDPDDGFDKIIISWMAGLGVIQFLVGLLAVSIFLFGNADSNGDGFIWSVVTVLTSVTWFFFARVLMLLKR